MKIVTLEEFRDAPNEPKDLVSFAASALNGGSYDTGAVEEAQYTANNCAEAIGRLLALLASKGQLTPEEFLTVLAAQYRVEKASFVE